MGKGRLMMQARGARLILEGQSPLIAVRVDATPDLAMTGKMLSRY